MKTADILMSLSAIFALINYMVQWFFMYRRTKEHRERADMAGTSPVGFWRWSWIWGSLALGILCCVLMVLYFTKVI